MESAFEMAGDDGKCPKCLIGEAIVDHTCPYACDVGDDCESLCDCCADCEYECAMDI